MKKVTPIRHQVLRRFENSGKGQDEHQTTQNATDFRDTMAIRNAEWGTRSAEFGNHRNGVLLAPDELQSTSFIARSRPLHETLQRKLAPIETRDTSL